MHARVLGGGRGARSLGPALKGSIWLCGMLWFAQIWGPVTNEIVLQGGFRIHEGTFSIESSSFKCFWFWLTRWDKCSLGWTHQCPPAKAEVVGYFYEVWVFVLWLGWLILSAAHTKHCLPILLPIRHSTSHTSISPAHTQPQLMDTAHAQTLMHLRTEVATAAHAARLIVVLNNSPHACMLAHSELWPRFSGTAPWRTCRRTRSSAGL